MHRPRHGLLVLLFLGVTVTSRPTEAEPGVAFVETAERNVLPAPYERGLSQLVTQTLFQVRLTASNTPAEQASRSPRRHPTR